MRHFAFVSVIFASVSLSLAEPNPAIGSRPPTLFIKVIQGNGAVNSTTTPNVVTPKVIVFDGDQQPVPGVAVTFTIDRRDLSSFRDGETAVTTQTDAHGVAIARGFIARKPGNITVSVTAEKDGARASEAIHQRNWKNPYSAATGGRRKKWPIVVAGAGAAGALAAYTISSVSGAAAPTATITAGQISLSGPR